MRNEDLFRKLERNLGSIEHTAEPVRMLSAILERLVEDFRDDLGLIGGRVYEQRGEVYELLFQYPERTVPSGFTIPVSYDPVRELRRQQFVLHELADPGIDRDLERALGVDVFAAICVGEGCRRILALSVKAQSDREHIVYTLNTIRHVINLKLRDRRLENRVDEAREIHLSLLPRSEPAFGDFEIHGATAPAEEVGGDLYDLIEVSPRSLGIAVVDASGHGLPAALQARDAIIGLRMGVEERLRITATLEKLNRVIARSALASKFIAMFYGEIEKNGTLVYCNAGQMPPLLRTGDELVELRAGGRVLGPSPDAQYERGYAVLEPGSVLLAYTDGITEAADAGGEEFGRRRLRELISRRPRWSARELVETVFDAVRTHSARSIPADDQTVLAVTRPPAGS